MPVEKPHHLIYGTLQDYLTDEELTDTDDERIRQELSRLMVEEKGYDAGTAAPANPNRNPVCRRFCGLDH